MNKSAVIAGVVSLGVGFGLGWFGRENLGSKKASKTGTNEEREEGVSAGWKPRRKREEEAKAEAEHPSEEDDIENQPEVESKEDLPRVMPYQEYMLNDEEVYSKHAYTWYAEDKVLTDELEEVVDEPAVLLGDDIYQQLVQGKTPALFYVHNEAFKNDYEICVHQESYHRDFLGEDDS